MSTSKEHISLVVVGHVDSGKSTTTGHLLFKCGSIDPREMERFEAESAQAGKSSFKYAWVFDRLQAERERGITIDITAKQFETATKTYTVIDAPGHRDFVKNMITGASSADVGMLVVSAANGEFEAGLSRGGQTREHALLAFTLGVRQLVVVVNKMDADTVNFSRERYNHVKDNVSVFLRKVGYDPEAIHFIPISGFQGDNITTRSDRTPWYSGPTLLDALDAMPAPKRYVDKPLRIPIQEVYRVGGIGTVVIGRIATGVLQPGKMVTVGRCPGTATEVTPAAGTVWYRHGGEGC